MRLRGGLCFAAGRNSRAARRGSAQPYRFYLKIAIIFRLDARKPEHGIIGVGNPLFVKKLIAEAPNLVLCGLIGTYLHRALYGNALIFKPASLVKIDASFGIFAELRHFFRRGIGGKIDVVPVELPRSEHCPRYREALPVHRR